MSTNNQVKTLATSVTKSGMKISKSKLIEMINKTGKQEFSVIQSDSELIVHLVNIKA
jgi:hypothetical protein